MDREAAGAADQRRDDRGRVAYLFGSDRQHGRVLAGGAGLHNDGSTDIRLLRSDPDDFLRLHVPANFGRLKTRLSLDRIGVVLNMVTDPDLNPKVLGWAEKLLKPFRGTVLNPPAAVRASSRDGVARLLADVDGLVVPPVARFRGHPPLARAAIARSGLRFPAILRVAGTHNGEIVGLVADEAALLAAIRPDTTYLLTQFADVRDGGGLYHKIRIFFFGVRSVIRHCLISDMWNVHGPDRERIMPHHPGWIARERVLLGSGIAALPDRARATLRAVRARIPLDFFGLDFALLPDDRLLLYEANATMNFFPLSTHPMFAYTGEPVVAVARAAVDRMIAEAAGGPTAAIGGGA